MGHLLPRVWQIARDVFWSLDLYGASLAIERAHSAIGMQANASEQFEAATEENEGLVHVLSSTSLVVAPRHLKW
jgi:hypothetical protein